MVTVDEVRKCVVKLTSKSCDLDPLPFYVTRKALGTLILFITKIINTSLQSSQMPSQLKVAKLRALYFSKAAFPELCAVFKLSHCFKSYFHQQSN